MSKHRILSAAKQSREIRQYNTRQKASSTVRSEPVRGTASETKQGKKGREGEAYDNGNYVRERRQAL